MHKITKALINGIGTSPYYVGQTPDDMLQTFQNEYLTKSGYIDSIVYGVPIRNGRPIPWITYSCLDYLERIIPSDYKVVEFGGGFSTLYWALRGNPITFFESDPGWEITINNGVDLLDPTQRAKCLPMFRQSIALEKSLLDELKKLYLIENNVEVKNVKIEISQFLTDKINGSELIMIDGILRNYLLELCANSKFKGVIVLDNADRKEYTKGISELESKGWIQTSFSGIGPINPYGWTTSVFHINK
jgi:hypothetical protein